MMRTAIPLIVTKSLRMDHQYLGTGLQPLQHRYLGTRLQCIMVVRHPGVDQGPASSMSEKRTLLLDEEPVLPMILGKREGDQDGTQQRLSKGGTRWNWTGNDRDGSGAIRNGRSEKARPRSPGRSSSKHFYSFEAPHGKGNRWVSLFVDITCRNGGTWIRKLLTTSENIAIQPEEIPT